MKKSVLSIAVLLLGLPALSQEAENLGKYAEVQLISRLDFNPYFTPGQSGDGSSGYTFGNSSIYTLWEGAFSERLSYLVCVHPFILNDPSEGFFAESSNLYKNSLMSMENTWLDYAYVNYSFGNFDITLGKDAITAGAFEFDEWDWDAHFDQASALWNSFPVYQWGIKGAYTTPSENTTISFQMLTSPFGERPFASGLYTYSGQLNGNYGPFSNIWSISAVGRSDGKYDILANLGQQLELGNFTLGLDWFNSQYVDYDGEVACFSKGHTFRPTIVYAPSERFDCSLKANFYTSDAFDGFNGGLAFHFYPLKESQAIRLHAVAAYDSYNYSEAQLGLTIGATFNFSLLSL